jgi:ABC-type multidrug transport system fused ATPase/permease subunit
MARRRGDIIFRAGTDTCAFQTLFLHGFLIFISAAGTLLFMAVAMARLDLRLTGVALVAVPVLLLSIKVFGRAMRERGTVAQQAESKIYALIHQGITALPLIQSNAREHHERQRFTAHTEEARHHKMAQQGLEVFYWGSISVILSACTLGVTWVGAQQVLNSTMTVGELLVFLAYVAQLFEPLNQLSQVGATLSSARASTRRVFEILDTPEEVKSRPEARPLCLGRDLDGSAELPTTAENMFVSGGGAPAGSPPAPLPVYGNVTYDDVSFGYESSRPVLRHISFKLLAGTSAAIIGPSGAGKTTLLNLLPRFFDPRAARSSWKAWTCATSAWRTCERRSPWSCRSPSSCPPPWPRTSPTGSPARPWSRSRLPRTPPAPTSSSRSCPITIERSSGTGARG